MIRDFNEWLNDNVYAHMIMRSDVDDLEEIYNIGVKEASDHFEEERILIHEYYTKQVKKLVGNETEIEPYSENNGKLT